MKVLQDAWIRAWEALVLKISHAHTNVADCALRVMKLIVEHQLIDAQVVTAIQGNVWKLFVFNDFHPCTWTAVDFLITFLNKYELREDGVDTLEGSSRREKHLQWISSSLRQVYETRVQWEDNRYPKLVSQAIITLLQLNFQQNASDLRPLKDNATKKILHSANTIVHGISIPCLEDMTIDFDKHQMKLEAQLTQVEGKFDPRVASRANLLQRRGFYTLKITPHVRAA
jgi:hypothetical protein